MNGLLDVLHRIRLRLNGQEHLNGLAARLGERAAPIQRIITKRRAVVRLLRIKARALFRDFADGSSRGDWTASVSVLSLVAAVIWWSASGAAGGVTQSTLNAGPQRGEQSLAMQRTATPASTVAATATRTATATATSLSIPAAPSSSEESAAENLSDEAEEDAEFSIPAAESVTESVVLTSGAALTDLPGGVILAAPIGLEDEAIEGSVSTTDVVSTVLEAEGTAAGDVVATPGALEGVEGLLVGNGLVGDVVGNIDALFGDETDAATPTPDATALPRVRVLAGEGGLIPQFPTVTPTPGPPPPTATATPVPLPLVAGRLWSNFEPLPPSEADHFWIGRAFPQGVRTQLASPSYQFGSTAGGRYRAHHGVDIGNPSGTPVLAATEGTVVHAGPDNEALLGPYNNFYGNTIVIRLERQLPVAGGALDVYLLYGHLSAVNVEVGQTVSRDEVVGAVGMTGIAIGPHLHVEIRVGANTYEHNVNPYLWMEPLPGMGAVAVRVLSAEGRTWPGAVVGLVRYDADGSASWGRQIITYQDIENIGPDPAWGENGAMDGVPAGAYRLATVINGERLIADITVNAGETTFVEMRTEQ